MDSTNEFFGAIAQPSRGARVISKITGKAPKQPQPRYRRTSQDTTPDVDPETRWDRRKLDQMSKTPKLY